MNFELEYSRIAAGKRLLVPTEWRIVCVPKTLSEHLKVYFGQSCQDILNAGCEEDTEEEKTAWLLFRPSHGLKFGKIKREKHSAQVFSTIATKKSETLISTHANLPKHVCPGINCCVAVLEHTFQCQDFRPRQGWRVSAQNAQIHS